MACEFKGAVAVGPISRSAHTAVIHRRVRDGYASADEFKKAIAEDREKILEAQKQFAFISAGQADWLDAVRPMACQWDGFSSKGKKPEEVGPVTRWFRTNTFYRRPTVQGKINATGTELKNSLPGVESNGIIFLLGPYSFSKLVENTYYSDRIELASDYVQAVSKSMAAMREQGYSAVLFLEPYVGYNLSRQETIDWNEFQEPWKKLDAKEMTVGVHFAKVDIAPILGYVEEIKIDFVGIDTFYTQPEKISTSKDILFGIVDGGRAGIENKDLVKKQLELFLGNTDFSDRYYIGPNDRLWDVPLDIALEKLKLLHQIGREL